MWPSRQNRGLYDNKMVASYGLDFYYTTVCHGGAVSKLLLLYQCIYDDNFLKERLEV